MIYTNRAFDNMSKALFVFESTIKKTTFIHCTALVFYANINTLTIRCKQKKKGLSTEYQ